MSPVPSIFHINKYMHACVCYTSASVRLVNVSVSLKDGFCLEAQTNQVSELADLRVVLHTEKH